RLGGPATLAAQAALALRDDLARDQAQVEVELSTRDAQRVALALLLHAPVVDPDPGTRGFGLGERKSGARRALLVQQAAAARIGNGCVREKDLPRCEGARVGRRYLAPDAEEGDLEPDRVVQPSGDVPPLRAE